MLNRLQPVGGFSCKALCRREDRHPDPPGRIEIEIEPHQGRRGQCRPGLKPGAGDDPQPQPSGQCGPRWGISTPFLYAPRRGACAAHGMGVAPLPGRAGQRPVTLARMCFLATRARRLAWRETARAFRTRWESGSRAVAWFVEGGLTHRKPAGIVARSVDEIQWSHGPGAKRC